MKYQNTQNNKANNGSQANIALDYLIEGFSNKIGLLKNVGKTELKIGQNMSNKYKLKVTKLSKPSEIHNFRDFMQSQNC